MAKYHVHQILFGTLLCFSVHAQDRYGPVLQLDDEPSTMERIRSVNRSIQAQNDQEGIDSLLQYVTSFAKEHDDRDLLKELHYLTAIQRSFTEQDARKRIRIFRSTLTKEAFKDDALYKGIILQEIGQNQFVLEEYGAAFQNSLKAQQIFRQLGYNKVANIGKYLHDLALDYYFFQNYEEVIKTMRLSTRLPKFNKNLDIQRYNTLRMAYLKLNQSDSALLYLDTAYQKAVQYRDTVWMGLVSGNIGEVYYAAESYQQSVPYFQKNYQLNKGSLAHFEVPLEAYADMAKAYMKTDSLAKARKFILLTEGSFPKKRAFKFGEQQGIETFKRQHYENCYTYYLKISAYQQAIRYRDSLRQVERAIDSKYNTAVIKMAQDQLRIQENRERIALQEQEKIALHFRYSLSVIAISLLAVIGFALYYVAQLKKKKERQVWLSEQRIRELAYENTRQSLKHAQLELQNLIQKTRENQQLIAQLQETKTSVKTSLLASLKEKNILTANDWDNFKKSFTKVYPNFIHSISCTYPFITQAEIRCLCLGKLQLSNNEMALMLGVSTNTILVTQHRIRKKLGLTKRDELRKLIHSI
ncbi:helix-turn-helix transcriptional regulator [Olivibacter sp. SDN3]|uniref:helix-turn-helix transcriptional regulator n=1 Tax=Olivibacter sp. SDN3 TaxID=2764720 RepID=UPI0016518E35|nr:helix-turn-helix transcriptional regulator [Olivibacter sp. SDN3]QNL48160.1 helix-turn-helix transcriptional regulator [Olivibacter sp. SDN3]